MFKDRSEKRRSPQKKARSCSSKFKGGRFHGSLKSRGSRRERLPVSNLAEETSKTIHE